MIIFAPLCFTHRVPVTNPTVLDWLWVSLKLCMLRCEKVILNFTKVGEILLNEELLRFCGTSKHDVHVFRSYSLNARTKVRIETELNNCSGLSRSCEFCLDHLVRE